MARKDFSVYICGAKRFGNTGVSIGGRARSEFQVERFKLLPVFTHIPDFGRPE